MNRSIRRPSAMSARVLITRGGMLPCTGLSTLDWEILLAGEKGLGIHAGMTGEQLTVVPHQPYVLVGADWVLATAARHGLISDPVSLYQTREDDE
jgi:hypothetical protein